MLAKRYLIILRKLFAMLSGSKDNTRRNLMKNKKCAMEIAILRLGHIPYVFSGNRKMAVWSDVKEVLLWCPDRQCSVVLNAMKMMLGYPASERAMHPCSQLEQLLFLKHFMFITNGTLLVDLDSVRNATKLAVLYDMVRQKHDRSIAPVVLNCKHMLKTITEKYTNTSFKIPLSSVSSKRFLPAVRRIMESVSAIVIPTHKLTNKKSCLKPCDTPARGSSLHNIDNGAVESAVKGEPSSRTLVPLALLSMLYPGCEEYLEEVVRLYMLGRCREENLHSICQCTVEEGIQLTRFVASQNGYETSWVCLTSASLMMSWSEFWIGLDRMYGGVSMSMPSDVCVVTLNCQRTKETQKGKIMPRWTMPTQLSPPLSTITDITENVQSHSTKSHFISLNEESQNDQILGTEYSLHGKTNMPEVKTKLYVKLPISEGIQTTETLATDEDVLAEVLVSDEGQVIETSVEIEVGTSEALDIDNGTTNTEASLTDTFRKENNEDKSIQLTDSKKQNKVGKRDRKQSKKQKKKKLPNANNNKPFVNQTIGEDSSDRKTALQASVCLISPKLKKSKIPKKAKIKDKSTTAAISSSRGIKSRLRSNHQESKALAEEHKIDVGEEDANNSAMNNTITSIIAKTGSGDTNSSDTKLVELAESSTPTSGRIDAAPFRGTEVSHSIGMKVEMPMSKVSQYDLASITHTEMESIQVHITPKNAPGIQHEDVPEELSQGYPLLQRQKPYKSKLESTPVLKASRQTLRISPAQLKDEIPSNLRCAPKIPNITARCSPRPETVFRYPKTKHDEEVNQIKDLNCQSTDTSVIAHTPRYKFLSPKKLQLTAPMLKGPDPNGQDAKKIPYKPVKNIEDSTTKQHAETLQHCLNTQNILPSLEEEKKCRKASAGASKDSPHGPAQQLTSDSQHNTSMLHEEIVNSLQRQALNSKGLVSGNQLVLESLVAEGTTMRAFSRTRDMNSSEFMKERILLWKDEIEQSLLLQSPDRPSKSAGFVRKQHICTDRPKSSMQMSKSPGFYQGSPSFKNALCAVFSRDRASTNVINKGSCFHSSPKEAFAENNENLFETDITDNFRKEMSNHNLSSAVITDSVSKAQTPEERDTSTLVDHYDLQNFGSSSSTTPDIYDEFARKRKPKPPRPETVQIKPKSFFTGLSQPILRTQAQTPVKVCTKPNYHTVGYNNHTKTTEQSNQFRSHRNLDQNYKQIYQHTGPSQTQNLPYSSLIKEVNFSEPEQCHFYTTTSNSICSASENMKADKNEIQTLSKEFEKRSFTTKSHQICSETQSTESQVDPVLVQSFPLLQYSPSRSETWHNPYLTAQKDHRKAQKQPLSESIQKEKDCSANSKCSFAEKKPFYTQHFFTPGKLESMECVNDIQSILSTSPLYPPCIKNTDNMEQSLPNHLQSNKTIACAKNESIVSKQYARSQSALESTKHGKQEIISIGPKIDIHREKMLAKVNSQLYYKVPNDDKFYPVSENMMIPRHAQFFVQDNLTENYALLPSTKSVPSKKGIQTFHEDANSLKKSLNVLETPMEINEANRNDARIERDYCEIKENERSSTDISVEDRLSDTTFDSIIKASEVFIDKSKKIKHIISETKSALEKATEEEIDEKLGDQLPDTESGASRKTEENICRSDDIDSSKTVVPSLGLIVERKNRRQNKSFKQVIAEKRAEKKRMQQVLSKKKFWNSAYMKKEQFNSSQDDQSDTQLDKTQTDLIDVKFLNHDSTDNNECPKQPLDNNTAEVKHSERSVSSKFVIAYQPRPKSCAAKNTGRVTKSALSSGNRTKTDPYDFYRKPSIDYTKKQNQDKNVYTSSSNYQQTSKPVTIFPRSMCARSHQQREADDCANKVLTALRRLSIEKSPKKDQQESPKKEVRQHKLRASVMRQLPRTPNQISDHKSNDHKRGASVSAINSDEYNEDSHSENVEEESSIHSNDDNCRGKIPVVISVRINQIEHIPESSKDDGFRKYGTTVQKENENEQRHTNVVFQQSEIQSPYSRYNQTTSKSDSNSNSQNKELSKDIDISLCNAREQTLIDSFSAQSSSSSISVDKQKYLGIPYFDEANSNMNNTKFMYPPFSCKTAPSYRVNQGNFLEQVIEQLPDVSSEQCDCYLETTNNGDVDEADKDGIGYQAAVSTENDITTNENQQSFNFANEDDSLREVIKNTSKNSGTTNMQICAGNGVLNDEGIVPNVSYVQNSMLYTESTEILPDSSLDTEWLKMALMIDTEGNIDDNHYFATAEISKELVASEKEIKPDHIHNGSLTYFEYEIPPTLQQQSNVGLSETTNEISFSDGRNLSETVGKKTGHPFEILAENKCFQHVCDTIPIQNVNVSANNKNTDTVTSFLSQSGIPVTLMHYTDKETFNYDTGTELADSQGCEYTVSVINEDWDHYYQLDSQCNTLEMQEQPTQTMSFEGNNSNGSNSCDIFLDETECGQEVCIGDKEMSDEYEQDLERGIGDPYENEICCRIESIRSTSAENCSRGNNKNEGEKKDNINIDPNLIPKNNKLKNIYEKQTNEKGIECLLSKDSCKTSKAKGGNQTDKKEMKKKRQNQKNKKTSTGNSKLKFSPAEERYSPSESEVEAYFNELEKRTEAEDPNLIVNKNGCSPQADYSLPDIKLELSKQTPCLKDKVRVENLKDDISRKNDNLEKRVYTETLSDNENVIDDDIDDDDDKDYNPDDDINDLYNSSETDSDTEEDFANDSFAKSTSKMKKEKSKTETKTESSYNRNENTDKKSHAVSIEKLRKKFQKKYDIKNSSTINKLKQKSLNQKAEDSQQNTSSENVGQNTCSKNLGKKEKSIVREFCSKKKETCYVHLENVRSEKQPTSAKTRLADDRYVETSKNEEFDEREGKQNHNTEKLGSNSITKCRKKKSRRKNKNISQGEGENTEDEKKGIAAEGFIKTQKLYYDILRKASVGAVKEDIKEHIEKRVEEPCAAEDLSKVIEAVPVHGERVITKALSDAEKALEGTGSLEDIHNDDNEGTVIEDLINQCSYQMIEDEDHIQLGGIAYFKDFTLPFVYVNGYKFTTLKDALTIFTPACCISACTIPRSVLQKYKVLVKSLTTWDQVYKLELIKLKKGPPIMTGDVLLKLDTFVVQLPEIIDKIFEQHIGTKLKRSKNCNISEYKSLKSKFV